MTEMAVESELGCGFIVGVFQRWRFWPRKTPVHSLPTISTSKDTLKVPAIDNSKRKQSSSAEYSVSNCIDSSNFGKPTPKFDEKPTKKTQGRRVSDAARSSISSSTSNSAQTKVSVSRSHSQDSGDDQRRLQRKPPACDSINHQQVNESRALVRATSSNVMVSGHLGNLRQKNELSRNLQNMPNPKNGIGKLCGNAVMGNIMRKNLNLMNKLDPEVLKSMGNEAYGKGRFEEALALYDRAIALDSNKATYRSNKSAALTGLGRLMEAIFECREAVRIEPSYHRAHNRLAKLYLRVGEAERALYHYKQSGPHAESKDIAQAQALQKHLSSCTEARKLKEWNALLKHTQCAISSSADSSPQFYALQAEALLKLYRHEEAYFTYQKGPKFSIDSYTKLFGMADSAYLLIIEAQVYLAAGRLEDAVVVSQYAARLDPSSKEVSAVVKRATAVASARQSGNVLFKASKYMEACLKYSEGLEYDPFNSVLLCNRAACRSKLRLFENAVEDCTTALNLRPSYFKARLRRANCNAKLERWQASIEDYETLIRETPGDEEVEGALFDAQIQLKKHRGDDIKDMIFGSNLFLITSNEHFRHFVTSPGMSVVLFCNKTNHKQVMRVLEQVCKRFTSVNFLKVEVEDHPYIAKVEGVSSIPVFKIYKNGSMVKEIAGNNREILESSIKLYVQ